MQATASDQTNLASRVLTSFKLSSLDNAVDRRNLKIIALLFAALAATTYAVGWLAWKTYGLPKDAPTSLTHTIFDRWDVLNYVLIAENGYGASEHHVVWFPAMPGLMRLGDYVGIAPWLTGTVVILACALVLTLAFYALSRLDFAPGVSRDATIFLLVFPTCFFLFVPYTEAMLLVLVVASFYCARQGHWMLAAVLAGLASGVRITGLFIGPALLVEYLHQKEWRWREVRPDIAWLALAPAGLMVFMAYLWVQFDNPLEWYDRQFDFPRLETEETKGGVIRFIPSLIEEVRLIWDSPVFGEQVQNGGGAIGLAVFIALFAGMLYFRLRPSYIAFAAMAGFIPLMAGRLESVNRYIIAAFPMFMVMGLIVERWPAVKTPLIAVFLGFFFLLVVRFSTYEWAG
ncbi:MAG TPA: glycosyltransferase 87 family protein [Dehalococcoidia bacterium]|nr:glycosyltransferase 87 family protein [Dehalococcoidia bacterium]